MRRYPIGAEPLPGGAVDFRVWAPERKHIEVVFEDGTCCALKPSGGYFGAVVREAGPGSRYKYRVDGKGLFPDPASRSQPEGPHGPSEVIDPSAFVWTDAGWPGRGAGRHVTYEMHIGTFTPEGTFDAVRKQLPELASAGIEIVEVMPLADFQGRFGWGYDGVCLFAPARIYGTPDDLRRLVNDAHGAGIAVILDVVYNHLGPEGNYLKEFSPEYFTDRYENEWGEALNFDGAKSGPVREFFATNAAYWIDEFHMDGLRLDATQQIFDSSPVHILREIGDAVRQAARGRKTYIVAENEPQHTRLVLPAAEGGYELDALWNDDYHHSARVALTGHNEAYYTDYRGGPQEFISALKYGYLYQGQRYTWQKSPRGTPGRELSPAHFVAYLENHDQVANSGRGQRVYELTAPGRYRAMATLLLLGPNSPLLFQGQEFGASAPFNFFADHEPELSRKVREGRREFLSQFRSLARPEMTACIPDPGNLATFERCKLDFSERETHGEMYRLHKDLMRLRREDRGFEGEVDGAVLAEEAFVVRFFSNHGGGDRLLLINLGRDLHLVPSPEPLLAPPEGMRWQLLWSSEDPRYGGSGTFPPESEDGWRLPGHAAVVVAPEEDA